jgi:hypothetical protein
MLHRRMIPLGKGLLAVFFLLGALHADQPPENRLTTETVATDVPAPAHEPLDVPSAEPESPTAEPDTPSRDTIPPIKVADHAHPATNQPEHNGETDELAAPLETGESAAAQEPIQPVDTPDAVDASVRVEPVVLEPGPPPLQREDIEAVAMRLAAIEESLTGQQERALELVVSSNRTALIVAGLFAGVGLLAILTAAMILGRILNRFSDVVMTLPAGQPPGRASAISWAGYEGLHPAASTAFEQVSARFLGAIEQLEERIRQLERLPQPQPLHGEAGNGARQPMPTATGVNSEPEPAEPEVTLATPEADIEVTPNSTGTISSRTNEQLRRVEELLVEGENLLQSNSLDAALERFEDALALAPQNADALIKRGMTLERLQRMEAALESYDRAIASNSSLTLAYLHKGAVCNRLQRYREALECYERALQTEHKP